MDSANNSPLRSSGREVHTPGFGSKSFRNKDILGGKLKDDLAERIGLKRNKVRDTLDPSTEKGSPEEGAKLSILPPIRSNLLKNYSRNTVYESLKKKQIPSRSASIESPDVGTNKNEHKSTFFGDKSHENEYLGTEAKLVTAPEESPTVVMGLTNLITQLPTVKDEIANLVVEFLMIPEITTLINNSNTQQYLSVRKVIGMVDPLNFEDLLNKQAGLSQTPDHKHSNIVDLSSFRKTPEVSSNRRRDSRLER